MSDTTAPETLKPTAEQILSAYVPDDKPVAVILPTGQVMTFKPITTSEDRRRLIKQISDFINRMPERGTSAFAVHPLKDLWPKAVEDQSISLILHFRALDPPISLATAFSYHKAPELVAYLEERLASADKEIAAIMRDRILEAAQKKSQTSGSKDESGQASDSSPDETSTN